MAKILPSINCHFKDDEAVVARVRAIEDIFTRAGTPPEDRMAHFDVADGSFTFNKSWNNPGRLASIKPQFTFEAHLMTENPGPEAKKWISAGAVRIVVHLETVSPSAFEEIASAARSAGSEVVLALNPETPPADAAKYFGSTSSFLVLAVHPGLSGQKFLPAVLEKVSFLRQQLPDAKIEVDGGINIETAAASVRAGADTLVSGSYIFENPEPESEYEALRSV